MLLAVRNHDLTNLLQACTPEAARKIQGELALSRKLIEEFYRLSENVPGVHVASAEANTNTGLTWLQLEFVPGLSGSRIPLRQTINESDLEFYRAALAAPAAHAGIVLVFDGDEIDRAVKAHPQGLTAVRRFSTPGKPDGTIYISGTSGASSLTMPGGAVIASPIEAR